MPQIVITGYVNDEVYFVYSKDKKKYNQIGRDAVYTALAGALDNKPEQQEETK